MNHVKLTMSSVGVALALFGGVNTASAAAQAVETAAPKCCAANANDLRSKIAKEYEIVSEDTWHGFHRMKFKFNGFTGWVVQPNVKPADGMPWTWTMQWAEAFVGRTGVPDLLGKGFHHVTLELFSTRMDEKGLETAAAFQKFLVEKLGFAPKANLIGMSWGGFFSTRYTNAYPQNVRRIYLDAPLLNFKEFGDTDPGRIGLWAKRKPADGDWSKDPNMPINMAESLAKTGIPILLLYGGVDTVVLPQYNSEIFIERFKAAGGNITVDKRNLFGHHPHGVDPNKTAVIQNFFMK